ncbi:MAG: glycine cleavage system aminomethyltransferase GcvT [Mariprofundales bacterium]|nr:glycine cleavage system aminomethyltransferase GcvT [Mariprofundales bacterium]
MTTPLLHTPLYNSHLALGARMVPFAGYAMPIQYRRGALQEYHATRSDGSAGLFDITHMGQVRIEGREALPFLQWVTSNDVNRLVDGQIHYSAMLSESGTFIDDITTYRIACDHYYLCINAANRERDVAHLRHHAARFAVTIRDESDETTLLALQGQAAQEKLQPLVDIDLESIGYYRFASCQLLEQEAVISRTGYTGEDGFELYLANSHALRVWEALLAAAATPIGLAARDMLRTEMGYALYGHEISDQVTPVEANLMWITKMDKGEFIGREAVAARRQTGRQRALIALALRERGIPRPHYQVLVDGRASGEITSGLLSPLANRGVALAYIEPADHQQGEITVAIRGRAIPAERTTTPFVRTRVASSRS